jgi:hypothetical protein
MKAIMRHLPRNTPAEDVYDGLVSLVIDDISVKQITVTRLSPPERSKIINLPLFIIILPRTAKFQEIFPLPSLCNIAIRIETYRAQNALTQCHNCQQFGHMWTNCKPTLYRNSDMKEKASDSYVTYTSETLPIFSLNVYAFQYVSII